MAKVYVMDNGRYRKIGGTYAEAIAAAGRAYLGANDRRADLALELRKLADQIESERPGNRSVKRP